MMKQGCNMSKFKRSDVGGIQKEQKRMYADVSKYNNDVIPELSENNVVIEHQEENNWVKCAAEKIKKHQKLTGKSIRKDAVIMCSIVETVPASWGKELTDEYFDMQHNIKFELLKKYGLDDQVKLSSITHYDETNPHRTDTFMPIHEGQFNFKSICKRSFYQELGKATWNAYKEFEKTHELPEKLEEPEWGSGKQRKKEQDYKAEKIEKKVEQLESNVDELEQEIANLEKKRDQVQGDVKTLSEINSIKPKKDILGHLGNITLDQFNKVKKMALASFKWREKYIKLKQDNDLLINEYRKLDAKYEDLKAKTPSVIELTKLNRAKKILDLIPEQVQREYAPHILGNKEKKRERSQER